MNSIRKIFRRSHRLFSVVTAVFLSAFVSLFLLSGMGCTTIKTAFSEDGVLYKDSAKANYEAGQKALNESKWEDAEKYFKQVKSKFPYSKYAVLSTLAIADAHFGDEKYLQAADTYRRFISMHPRHVKVPYASFRIAESYYKRMPERWFFLPPVEEKDQSAVYDCQRSLQDFLARYPNDEKAAQAKELLDDVHSRLIANELYAAKFYAKSGHWRAVAWRYERIVERFPQAKEAPEAMLQAAHAWNELGEKEQAVQSLRRLVATYPKSEAAKQAQLELQAAAQKAPAAQAAAQSPADQQAETQQAVKQQVKPGA